MTRLSPGCAIALVGAFVLLPAVAHPSSPAAEPCDPNPAANERLTLDALRVAVAVLPSVTLAPSARCHLFGTTRMVSLERYPVDQGRIRFYVDAKVLGEGGRWRLVPFASRADFAAVAKHILNDPVVMATVDASAKLHCLAGTNAPGKVPSFRCSTTGWGPFDQAGSGGRLKGTRTEFEFLQVHDLPSCNGCRPFGLIYYSVPASGLPEDAPGWCTVRRDSKIEDFARAHRVKQVILSRSGPFEVKVIAEDGAQTAVSLITEQCWCSLAPACEAVSRP